MSGKRGLNSRAAKRRSRKPVNDIDPLLGRASAAAAQGAWTEADHILGQAIALNPDNADLHHNRAEIQLAAGDTASALFGFCRALSLNHGLTASAERLANLLGRVTPAETDVLEPAGLAAAFRHEGIDHDAIARAAFARLVDTEPLRDLLAAGRGGDWQRAADNLLGPRGREAVRDPLFLGALRHGICRQPSLERLLTAVRRQLLVSGAGELMRDKPLSAFACALAHQCLNNEYVFSVSDTERRALSELRGDEASLLLSLYMDPETLLSAPGVPEVERLRPRALRDLVRDRVETRAEERALAGTVAILDPITDPVSKDVADQYESNPYPRWLTVTAPAAGSKRNHIAKVLDGLPAVANGTDTLAFFDRPFDVLVAGCGTGRHAIQAALAYRPYGRVTAIDLSRASLAYGMRMVRRLGVTNVDFLQADILSIGGCGRRFAIIESAGALHHMAEPLKGWRSLADALEPGGLMFIGLYSERGRDHIKRLRGKTGFSRPVTDDDIRSFRAHLLKGAFGKDGERVLNGTDFYTLSACRDLLFHVQEHRFTMEGLESAMNSLGHEHTRYYIQEYGRGLSDQ